MARKEEAKLRARILAAELNPDHELCPVCAGGYVVSGTAAGDRFGVCPECYERGLRNAEYAAQKALIAKTEREMIWKRTQRLRAKFGVTVDKPAKPKAPIF